MRTDEHLAFHERSRVGSRLGALGRIQANIPAPRLAAQREASELAAALAAFPTGSARYHLISFDFKLDNLARGGTASGFTDSGD